MSLSAMILIPALWACAGAGSDTAVAAQSEAERCDRVPALSYSNFGQQLMDTHCAGCHSSLLPEDLREGAPLGVDLDTYSGVLLWADRIAARSLGDAPTMPPGGGPEDDERARLDEWLACSVAQAVDPLQQAGR